MTEPIRVLLADDHDMIRRGLRATLEVEDDIVVVGEAVDGVDARKQAVTLLPDVVLMDVKMPRDSGIDATAKIKAEAPSVKVVMLTSSDEEDHLFDAVKAGAQGYVLKEVAATALADTVRQVQGGQAMITPSMATKLLHEFAAISNHDREQENPRPTRLTPRELEVLQAVARGQGNREVAQALFISENTVKNHMRNILEKLQLHSRVEAVLWAVREGIFEEG